MERDSNRGAENEATQGRREAGEEGRERLIERGGGREMVLDGRIGERGRESESAGERQRERRRE